MVVASGVVVVSAVVDVVTAGVVVVTAVDVVVCAGLVVVAIAEVVASTVVGSGVTETVAEVESDGASPLVPDVPFAPALPSESQPARALTTANASVITKSIKKHFKNNLFIKDRLLVMFNLK